MLLEIEVLRVEKTPVLHCNIRGGFERSLGKAAVAAGAQGQMFRWGEEVLLASL